jgi:hypothetical protein
LRSDLPQSATASLSFLGPLAEHFPFGTPFPQTPIPE